MSETRYLVCADRSTPPEVLSDHGTPEEAATARDVLRRGDERDGGFPRACVRVGHRAPDGTWRTV